jgi:hypothetical protein
MMADTLFSHDVGGYSAEPDDLSGTTPKRSTFVMMTNVTAAIVSLSLIVGIGVWGYKLFMRDVSGIPVVRAAEGAMRVAPEEPGGVLAEHQGLAVNAVAAEGAAAAPADRLVLAPLGVGLTEEDQPIMAEVPAAIDALEDAMPAAPEEDDFADLAPAPNTPLDRDALQAASINEVIAQLTGTSISDAPLNSSSSARVVQARVVTGADAALEMETEVLPLATPGVSLSMRPQLRPSVAPAVVVKAAFTANIGAAEVDANAIPSGTRLAQLGAYDSADVARSEWDRLQGQFGAYLEGKSRVVQQAQTGGQTFYRLRAMGFKDLSDARRFCSALVAENAECIPVVSR